MEILAYLVFFFIVFYDNEPKEPVNYSFLFQSIKSLFIVATLCLYYKAGVFVYITGEQGSIVYFSAFIALQVISFIAFIGLLAHGKVTTVRSTLVLANLMNFYFMGAYNNFSLFL